MRRGARKTEATKQASLPTHAITVEDIAFSHSIDDGREWYIHTDGAGREWALFRHLRGGAQLRRAWFAMVAEPGRKGRCRMLNTAIINPAGGFIQKDLLYDVQSDPEHLLPAVAALAKAGKFPADDAPLVGDYGQAGGGR